MKESYNPETKAFKILYTLHEVFQALIQLFGADNKMLILEINSLLLVVWILQDSPNCSCSNRSLQCCGHHIPLILQEFAQKMLDAIELWQIRGFSQPLWFQLVRGFVCSISLNRTSCKFSILFALSIQSQFRSFLRVSRLGLGLGHSCINFSLSPSLSHRVLPLLGSQRANQDFALHLASLDTTIR